MAMPHHQFLKEKEEEKSPMPKLIFYADQVFSKIAQVTHLLMRLETLDRIIIMFIT